jgi:Abnormal spindle-like microcephaly-assoc'd, ASPM-SPD-2-Hydin
MRHLVLVYLLMLPIGLGLSLPASSADAQGSGEPLFHDSGTVIFNFVSVGSISEAQSVTISNAGEGKLVITAIEASDTRDFSIVTDGCIGMALSSGQACTLSVVFHPAVVGTRYGSLEITSTRSACKNYVAMAGSGTKTQAPAAANAADCIVSGPPIPGKTVIVPGQTTTTQVPATPQSEADALQLVSPPKCVYGRHIRLDLHTSKADQIVAADIYINGHLDKVVREQSVSIVSSDLPHRQLRRYRVQVLANIAAGGTLGLTRYFSSCRRTPTRDSKSH